MVYPKAAMQFTLNIPYNLEYKPRKYKPPSISYSLTQIFLKPPKNKVCVQSQVWPLNISTTSKYVNSHLDDKYTRAVLNRL